MKFLLINPPIYDFSAYDVWIKPLGLLYISSILKSFGHEVVLFDCLSDQAKLTFRQDGSGKFYNEPVAKPKILENIPLEYKRYGIKQQLIKDFLISHSDTNYVLITSSMTYWYYGVKEIVSLVKEVIPKSKILLGGNYPILMPEHSKKLFSRDVDYIFHTGRISELLEYIKFETNTNYNKNFYDDFNNFPAPDYSHYSGNIPYVVLRTSYGCLYNCSYCASRSITPTYSYKNIETTLKEIKFLYDTTLAKNFVFYDDMIIGPDITRTKKFFTKLISYNLPIKFYTPNGINPKYIDKQIAQLMKQLNFVDPRLSLETISDKVHDMVDKKIILSEFEFGLNNLISSGYKPNEISVYILAGLPQESLYDVYKSVDFLAKYKVRIRLCEYSPVPKSKMFYQLGLNESIDPLLYNNSIFLFNGIPGKVSAWCSYKELQQLKEYIRQKNKKIVAI